MTTGWEDFSVGRTVKTPAVTVTESHVVQFASLTGDWYPLHTNAAWSAQGQFGQRVAHGPLTFGFAVGLMYQSQVFGEAIISWLGADKVRAKAPVFFGDTIHVIATVTDSRPSKNPSRGVVVLNYSLHNQREEEVMCFSSALLMRSRETTIRQ